LPSSYFPLHVKASSAEIYFIRPARHTLSDHKINEDILGELQIPQMLAFIEKYARDWKEHINRMNSNKTPKI
jgi:hypothetical protein